MQLSMKIDKIIRNKPVSNKKNHQLPNKLNISMMMTFGTRPQAMEISMITQMVIREVVISDFVMKMENLTYYLFLIIDFYNF